MAKLKDQLMEARTVAAPTLPPATADDEGQRPIPETPEDTIARLHAQNAILRGQLDAARNRARSAPFSEAPELPPHRQPAPSGATPAPPDPRHAIGTPGEGKRLYGVSLEGHMSRVVDREREVGVLVKTLPVWASNEGEAWMIFQAYNGICSTIHRPSCTVMSA